MRLKSLHVLLLVVMAVVAFSLYAAAQDEPTSGLGGGGEGGFFDEDFPFDDGDHSDDFLFDDRGPGPGFDGPDDFGPGFDGPDFGRGGFPDFGFPTLPPEFHSGVRPEDILGEKIGEIVFSRFTEEELAEMCPDVDAIVDKVAGYLEEKVNYADICEGLESNLARCEEAKDFCSEFGPRGPEDEEDFFSCPFELSAFIDHCVAKSTEYNDEEIEFRKAEINERCEFEWELSKNECERSIEEQRRFEEEEQRRREEDEYWRQQQEDERRRYEEENRCPEPHQPNEEDKRQCEDNGGFFEPRYDNGCLAYYDCVYFDEPEPGCPQVEPPSNEEYEECGRGGGEIVEEHDNGCFVGYHCEGYQEPLHDEPPVEEPPPEEPPPEEPPPEEPPLDVEPVPEEPPPEEPPVEETPPEEGEVAPADFFGGIIPGFFSLVGLQDFFPHPEPPPPDDGPHFGPPDQFCQYNSFMEFCTERPLKELEFDLSSDRTKRRCEFEATRMGREFERMCREQERGQEECLERTEEGCSFLRKQIAQCKDNTTPQAVRNLIRREATQMCNLERFRLSRSERPQRVVGIIEALSNSGEQLGGDFQTLLSSESGRIIDATTEAEEVEVGEGQKDFLYQIAKFMGAQREREVEEADRLRAAANELGATIESLLVVKGQIDDPNLAATLDEQINELKRQKAELDQAEIDKRNGANGVFGFFFSLFGG